MKISTPRSTLSALLTVFVFLVSGVISHAAKPTTPQVVPLGNNTYSVTCEARSLFSRDTQVLKNQATEAAIQYCTSQGKQMKLVTLTDEKPFYGKDFVKATIVFKQFDVGDPEFTAERSGPLATATDSIYTDLIKLEDLRKKGILTDAEFAAEKQKVLNRSK